MRLDRILDIDNKSLRDTCYQCGANLTPHDGGEDGRHDDGCPLGSKKNVYEVTYVVKARVEAFHEGEAPLVGEHAIHLPGNWSTPPEPVEHEGCLNGWRTKASVYWSTAVATKKVVAR